MIFGDQVRTRIMLTIGSLLRGPACAPLRFTPAQTCVVSNRLGDRHLEPLLNPTVEATGSCASIDPLELQIGQGIAWQQAWRWLSCDVPTLKAAGVEVQQRGGDFAPAKTPQPNREQINKALNPVCEADRTMAAGAGR